MAETAGAGDDPTTFGAPVVDLLGTVEVRGLEGQTVAVGRPQVQATLAYLLLERRPVTQGEVADLLWGDRPLSDHWKGAIRGVLSKVRDVLTEAGIDADVATARDGTVRLLVPAGLVTDVELASQAVDRAEGALATGEPSAALDAVNPWVDHLQQHLLPAGDGPWVRLQQDRVAELARRALTVLVSAQVELGRADLAAERARAWVQLHPLDEAVHELLIEALAADGRRVEASGAFDALARVLTDELGVGPSERITALVGTRSSSKSVATVPAGAELQPDPNPSWAATPAGIFLGRQHELEVLRQTWSSTRTGRTPRLAVISGKSGIGKTRLADELCAVAHADGAAVRWARCVPGEGLPFEPLASAVATGSTQPATSDPDADLPSDPTTARADAVRAIATGMTTLARGPAVLVIDDFQWASEDLTSALEQTLADTSGPLLVIITCRNLPPSGHEALARLQRSHPTAQLRLRGLDRDDLVPLFEGDSGERAEAEADELLRRTGGLPFFVAEMAIAPWRSGRPIDPADIPEAVRDWIGHRADALSKPVRARLDLASVIGDEFGIATLARCANADPDDVLDQLDVLVDDGFLVETDRVDVFAFPHLITRDAIYERIGATRRARMHAAVADALSAAPPAPGRHAAIARHLRAAGPDHQVAAGQMLLLAGREALDSGAWALAEQHYRAAGDAAPDDPAITAGALTGLARSFHLQRRRAEAEDLIDEALAIARVHRLRLELAEAALVLVGRAGRGATQRLSDLEQAALLTEALDGIEELEAAAAQANGNGDGNGGRGRRAGDAEIRSQRVRRASLACQLEGELALALSLTAPAEQRRALAQSAVARARSIDPPDTQLTSRALLTSRLSRLDPADIPGRLDDIDQVLAIAPTGRSVDTTLAALTYRHEDLIVLGRREASRQALDEARQLAAASQHPYWIWATATWTGLNALIDGDLEEAERIAVEASALQGPEEGGTLACLGVNLVNIRLYQGRSGEVLDLLIGAAGANPHIPCYRAVHAQCAAAAGEMDQADQSLGHFRSDGFSTIPEDTNRLLTLTALADTAVLLGDVESAALLLPLLLPASELQAILNCYGGGGAYWGPVAHQLARLAAITDDRAAAEAWFSQAEESAASMQATLALARITDDPVRSPHG